MTRQLVNNGKWQDNLSTMLIDKTTCQQMSRDNHEISDREVTWVESARKQLSERNGECVADVSTLWNLKVIFLYILCILKLFCWQQYFKDLLHESLYCENAYKTHIKVNHLHWCQKKIMFRRLCLEEIYVGTTHIVPESEVRGSDQYCVFKKGKYSLKEEILWAIVICEYSRP